MGKKWEEWQILFSWAPKSLWRVTAAKSSTAGEKDLKWGRVHNEKTDAYDSASGVTGLLLSMAGRQNGSFRPALLLAEVP